MHTCFVRALPFEGKAQGGEEVPSVSPTCNSGMKATCACRMTSGGINNTAQIKKRQHNK